MLTGNSLSKNANYFSIQIYLLLKIFLCVLDFLHCQVIPSIFYPYVLISFILDRILGPLLIQLVSFLIFLWTIVYNFIHRHFVLVKMKGNRYFLFISVVRQMHFKIPYHQKNIVKSLKSLIGIDSIQYVYCRQIQHK